MAKRGSPSILDQVNQLLQNPITLEEFRAKLSARDDGNIERHLAAMELEPETAHRELWTNLVRALATLAPHAASTTGQHAISFFIADGKYRMQVFALEDQRDGKLTIYAVDALQQAIEAKLLRPPAAGDVQTHHHELPNRQMLYVEPLNAQNTPNPSPFFKHMLGWNRTAMRITLPVHASEEQLRAATMLCALAAQTWRKEAPDSGAAAS